MFLQYKNYKGKVKNTSTSRIIISVSNIILGEDWGVRRATARVARILQGESRKLGIRPHSLLCDEIAIPQLTGQAAPQIIGALNDKRGC